MTILFDQTIGRSPAAPAGAVRARRRAWVRGFGLCRGQSEALLPGPQRTPSAAGHGARAAAKALCAECPVEQSCRDYGRRHTEYGIWGGETEEERVLAGVVLVYPCPAPARCSGSSTSRTAAAAPAADGGRPVAMPLAELVEPVARGAGRRRSLARRRARRRPGWGWPSGPDRRRPGLLGAPTACPASLLSTVPSGGAATGSRRSTSAPPPSASVIVAVPPWAAMFWATDREAQAGAQASVHADSVR